MAAIADVLHGTLTYAGGVTGTSAPTDFINRMQVYFNPQLLDAVKYNLVLAKYGHRKSYPANGLTIRFFRPRKASTAGVQALTEATVPTTKTAVAVGYKDCLLGQRGAIAYISDVVQATDLLDTLKLYVKTMGADAALDMDTVIRDALIAGLKDANASHPFERYPIGGLATVTADSSDDFDTFKTATSANGKITRTAHLGMVTQLKTSQVPMINGKYIAVTCPQVMHDVRQDTVWLAAAQNVDNQAM
jgi:N4-gp56 family major capsid protein